MSVDRLRGREPSQILCPLIFVSPTVVVTRHPLRKFAALLSLFFRGGETEAHWWIRATLPQGLATAWRACACLGPAAALALGEAPGAPVQGGARPGPTLTPLYLGTDTVPSALQTQHPALNPHASPTHGAISSVTRRPWGQSQGGAWVGPGSPSVKPPRVPATCGCEPPGRPCSFLIASLSSSRRWWR